MNFEKSQALYAQAANLMPGGVNSPVRAFKGVGGKPLFIERGAGAYIYDADGNRFTDYVLSWGPLILGHANPVVVEAIQKQATQGTSFGAPTRQETELAELVTTAVPSMEMLRFVSSGTEATMSALRVARAFTGRKKIVKFSGCYHGHADMLLVQAGSGVATLGLPDSPGVTAASTADTLTADYNNLPEVEKLFADYPDEIAAIILEPVVGNMGFVAPQPGFLEGLRTLTHQHGALLIFDEVMTGFRIGGAGGAQKHFGIVPDMTCLGKVIGGGLPVGAYGGRRDIMHMVAPLGAVYQAGTLSGNPLAMAAGIATLKELLKPGFYETLYATADALQAGMDKVAANSPIPCRFAHIGAMFGFFFAAEPVVDWPSAKKADTQAYAQFFWHMIQRGVYLAPSQFEAGFLSAAHSRDDINATVRAAEESINAVAEARLATR